MVGQMNVNKLVLKLSVMDPSNVTDHGSSGWKMFYGAIQ